MPIAGEYSWKETSTHCHVRVLLRGANPKTVDVYASDTYVKISYAPRLIELRGEDRNDETLAKEIER